MNDNDYETQAFWAYYKSQDEFLKSIGMIHRTNKDKLSNGLYEAKIAIINGAVIISEIEKVKNIRLDNENK